MQQPKCAILMKNKMAARACYAKIPVPSTNFFSMFFFFFFCTVGAYVSLSVCSLSFSKMRLDNACNSHLKKYYNQDFEILPHYRNLLGAIWKNNGYTLKTFFSSRCMDLTKIQIRGLDNNSSLRKYQSQDCETFAHYRALLGA